MRYIKYLMLCLIVAAFNSCSDKDVEYMFDKVDESSKAYVQIMYQAPVRNVAANYAYMVGINDQVYSNNSSAFLQTYNGIPFGGVGLFYSVDAGDMNLTLYFRRTVNGAIEYYENYNQVARGLQAGKHYAVVIHDLNAAPAVIEIDDVPTFPGSAETATHCSVKFYNFLYEEDGTPFQDKVQYALQNTETKEYEYVGEPVGFGEATSYFTPTIIKTVFNSSGYQRRDLTLYRIDATTGENKGILTYTNSAGRTVNFTDYWTWYIGRSYFQFLAGIRTSSSVPMRLGQYTAL